MIPNSGHIENGVHIFSRRIYYADTDAGGVVYHAKYLDIAEAARTEMLRVMKIEQQALRHETGLVFAVKKCDIDYIKPARLDDVLNITTKLVKMGGASFTLDQHITRDHQDIARLSLVIVCINEQGSPQKIPPFIKERF